MEITNKTFAIIGIIILGLLQLVAYALGFDGQLTVLITGIITYLFGIVTGQETKKLVIKTQKEVIAELSQRLLEKKQ